MAFMIGVRIISVGLAGGAAVIITTDAGRSAKDKLYEWAGDLKSRLPNRFTTAAVPTGPESDEQQLTPLLPLPATANDDPTLTDANLTEEVEESDHQVASGLDPTAVGAYSGALVAVRSDPVTVYAVRSDPATVDAVRSWCRKLLADIRRFWEGAPDAVRSWWREMLMVVCDFYKGVINAVERWGLGPDDWEKRIRPILTKILGVAIESFVVEVLKRNEGSLFSSFGQQVYYVVKSEMPW